jgi:hypothetical protein
MHVIMSTLVESTHFHGFLNGKIGHDELIMSFHAFIFLFRTHLSLFYDLLHILTSWWGMA